MFYFKKFNDGKQIAPIYCLAIYQHKVERSASIVKPDTLNSKKRHETKALNQAIQIKKIYS